MRACTFVYVCNYMCSVYRTLVCLHVYLRTDVCVMCIGPVYVCMCIYYVHVCLMCL